MAAHVTIQSQWRPSINRNGFYSPQSWRVRCDWRWAHGVLVLDFVSLFTVSGKSVVCLQIQLSFKLNLVWALLTLCLDLIYLRNKTKQQTVSRLLKYSMSVEQTLFSSPWLFKSINLFSYESGIILDLLTFENLNLVSKLIR